MGRNDFLIILSLEIDSNGWWQGQLRRVQITLSLLSLTPSIYLWLADADNYSSSQSETDHSTEIDRVGHFQTIGLGTSDGTRVMTCCEV